MGELAGLILVDKQRGWTSHDVVAAVRKLFPRKTKVGHSGTLDPMASGLLVLLVGRATKAAARFQGLPKTYSGSVRFGVRTETGDLEGKVVGEAPVPELSAPEMQKLFDKFIGEVELPVPAYSAVKHKGKPLYEYARKGIAVPEKRRKSTVTEWTLTGWERPEAGFRLRCSSGTYARALAMAAGESLGCGGALSALRRDEVGEFSVEDAVTVARLRETAAGRGCGDLVSPMPKP